MPFVNHSYKHFEGWGSVKVLGRYLSTIRVGMACVPTSLIFWHSCDIKFNLSCFQSRIQAGGCHWTFQMWCCWKGGSWCGFVNWGVHGLFATIRRSLRVWCWCGIRAGILLFHSYFPLLFPARKVLKLIFVMSMSSTLQSASQFF